MNSRKYLLDNEIAELERVLGISAKRVENQRDVLLINLLLNTGGRASEILGLKVEDYSPESGTILIRGLKDSNDRELPLSDELNIMMKTYILGFPKGEEKVLFPISYNRLYQIWQSYQPVKKKLHSLRHTFAIRLYRKTKDIRLVQFALGHKSINNTMIYSSYVYNSDELRRQIIF